MSTGRSLAKISCGRCQSKKIRCNRVIPQCDKCEAGDSECIYPARKPRSKKQGPQISEKNVLLEVLNRLKRLEEHCGLKHTSSPSDQENADDSMSISSVESENVRNTSTTSGQMPITLVPEVIRSIVNRIKDDGSRSMLLSNVFCHLRQVESCFFENEQCIRAIASAMSEIEFMQSLPSPIEKSPEEPIVSKELAKKIITNYYGFYQFEGFKIPLEKSFICSIPDLLEIPHVQLDYTSQIVFYTVLLQGIMIDPTAPPERGKIIQRLYGKCAELGDGWVKNIQDTPIDLFASFLMISMALEGCNVDLSYKAFTQACRISKALGYFSIDDPDHIPNPSPNSNPELEAPTDPHKAEVEKNRIRFEFWHILRTDCIFRLSFGKQSLIPAGSWKVNFPDPTINGVDDESSRFIQIHFLASMRLALIVMKYLDWIDCGADPDPVSHDATIDSFINEVQSILSDWDTEGLLEVANNHVDVWFCVDILFSSYKMLIVLYQSKICNRSHILPHQAVDIARKSVKIFQSLLASSVHAFWGISLILLHQFIPFFILCLDIVGNPDHTDLDADLVSIEWISNYVQSVVEQRAELKPVMVIMKAMATACQQTKMDRLSREVMAGA